jgi:hypothetical protein
MIEMGIATGIAIRVAKGIATVVIVIASEIATAANGMSAVNARVPPAQMTMRIQMTPSPLWKRPDPNGRPAPTQHHAGGGRGQTRRRRWTGPMTVSGRNATMTEAIESVTASAIGGRSLGGTRRSVATETGTGTETGSASVTDQWSALIATTANGETGRIATERTGRRSASGKGGTIGMTEMVETTGIASDGTSVATEAGRAEEAAREVRIAMLRSRRRGTSRPSNTSRRSRTARTGIEIATRTRTSRGWR